MQKRFFFFLSLTLPDTRPGTGPPDSPSRTLRNDHPDGHILIVEGVSDGKYHIVVRAKSPGGNFVDPAKGCFSCPGSMCGTFGLITAIESMGVS